MKEHCDYCTTVYDDNGDIVVWNCPKHAMVDDLLELYKLCQVCLTYTDWLDAEQDIRGAVNAIAKAEPQP